MPAEIGEKSHLGVYIYVRYVSSRAQKTEIFLVHHIYKRQLACESQTGSLAHFSVAVRNGTKKTTVQLLSTKVLYRVKCRVLLLLYLLLLQGKTVLKVRGSLNKGASGSIRN